MTADYRHIGGLGNRLGRHYSRFSPFSHTPALASQSLALRKLCVAGSNRPRRAKALPPCVSAIRFFKSRGPGDFKIDFQNGGGPIRAPNSS